ncbi:hypothetical protein [Achromobacter xylosoxidans]|uniref:hypothetical protein n=1 Tax=Alcaligenes xylosoxydans xylosoxydans TaxID=85698 RepID=UPI001EEF443B|nr:hypothetical protein [Achromobacter xylosoxidans]
MGIGDPAAQATRALLQLARDIAVGVLGSAEEGTVREVFARLCYEADVRSEGEPGPASAATRH